MVRSVRLCPCYSAMRPVFSFRRSFLLSAQRKYNSDTDYPNFQHLATAFDCRLSGLKMTVTLVGLLY